MVGTPEMGPGGYQVTGGRLIVSKSLREASTFVLRDLHIVDSGVGGRIRRENIALLFR